MIYSEEELILEEEFKKKPFPEPQKPQTTKVASKSHNVSIEARGQSITSVNQEEVDGIYKDDLAFLNKFGPEKVKRMSAPFKNAGRGTIT